jgi:hypothetical protein
VGEAGGDGPSGKDEDRRTELERKKKCARSDRAHQEEEAQGRVWKCDTSGPVLPLPPAIRICPASPRTRERPIPPAACHETTVRSLQDSAPVDLSAPVPRQQPRPRVRASAAASSPARPSAAVPPPSGAHPPDRVLPVRAARARPLQRRGRAARVLPHARHLLRAPRPPRARPAPARRRRRAPPSPAGSRSCSSFR